jgi:hypothetical protein
MKAILLSFVFIYFSESGLFKGLRRIQIKKFASTGVRAAGCERGVQTAAVSPIAAGWTTVLYSDNHDIISAYFCFVKVILDFLYRQPLAMPSGAERSITVVMARLAQSLDGAGHPRLFRLRFPAQLRLVLLLALRLGPCPRKLMVLAAHVSKPSRCTTRAITQST